MAQLAVDLALLPPEKIMEKIIRINHGLIKTSKSYFKLNKTDYLPHLTLNMGVIHKKDLPKLKQEINKLVKHHKPMNIIINDVNKILRPDLTWSSTLKVKKTKELQVLHEDVIKIMSKFLTYKGTVGMFYTPPPVEKLPLSWILNHHKNSILKKYKPHITLGLGVPPKIKLPFKFMASRIALCHLGNYCTCRKIFFEANLK